MQSVDQRADHISLEYQPVVKSSRLSARISRALAIMALVLVGLQVPWVPLSVYVAWGFVWGDNSWPTIPSFMLFAAPALFGIAASLASIASKQPTTKKLALIGLFCALGCLTLVLVATMVISGGHL